MAFNNAENNGYRYNSNYTADEAEMVDKAKRTHRETTSSAQRALKVAHHHLGTRIPVVYGSKQTKMSSPAAAWKTLQPWSPST